MSDILDSVFILPAVYLWLITTKCLNDSHFSVSGLLKYQHLCCRSGFFGTVVEYGAETKISRHSILGATVSVGVPQGVSLKIK